MGGIGVRNRPAPPGLTLFIAKPRPLGRLHSFPLKDAGKTRQLFSQELPLVFLTTHMVWLSALSLCFRLLSCPTSEL
jgi:hypothetical protein